MLIDNKILQRHGIYEVLAEAQAVVLPNNSCLQLHYVRRNGVDDIYLRAMEFQAARWCVFDLRTIDRSFASELPYAVHRDRPGLVLFTLRALFPSAGEFEASSMRNLEASWLAREPMPKLPIRSVQTSAITFQPELRRAAA